MQVRSARDGGDGGSSDDRTGGAGSCAEAATRSENVARLTVEAVIEQRSDGCYDQTASRLKYIKHLRDEHRRSPRTQADADHVKVKTEMLQLRLMEKKHELVRRADVDALIDGIAGDPGGP